VAESASRRAGQEEEEEEEGFGDGTTDTDHR